jgi:hypothetical protein
MHDKERKTCFNYFGHIPLAMKIIILKRLIASIFKNLESLHRQSYEVISTKRATSMELPLNLLKPRHWQQLKFNMHQG